MAVSVIDLFEMINVEDEHRIAFMRVTGFFRDFGKMHLGVAAIVKTSQGIGDRCEQPVFDLFHFVVDAGLLPNEVGHPDLQLLRPDILECDVIRDQIEQVGGK